jgi:site-specific DNA recombinase
MSKPRAVVYLRQSTFRDESISLELQEIANRTYAQQKGYDVVAVESDPGISGRTWNRPGVQKVLALIESRAADVIILWKWSRLSRSRLDWAVAADRVETMGGRIESATEQVDVSTSTGRLARGMLTEFAAFESERIGDTWKETHARRVRNGLPHHGLPRFGYTYTKQDGYTPDADSGPVLAAMYRLYASGATMRATGAYAASEGFEPEGGWRDDGLRHILDRGFGAGYIWSKGEHVKGAHEPVITEDEWVAYRVRRDQRAARSSGGKTNGGVYAYSGLVRCHCGARMDGGAVTRNGQKFRRYTCRDAIEKGSHAQVSISEPYVEEAVLEWLRGVAAQIDANTSTSAPGDSGNLGRKARQLAADVTKNARRIDSLTVKHIDGDVPREVYKRLLATLEEEKYALEARSRLVEVNSKVRPSVIAPQLLAEWADLPALGRRTILSKLVAKIQLHDWETASRKGRRTITVIEHRWDD